MAEVIDIFSGKARQEGEALEPVKPTHFSLSPTPGKVTQEQVMLFQIYLC